MIMHNVKKLIKPVDFRPIPDSEVTGIVDKLSDVISKVGGTGLAANQIGIDKGVCLINVETDPYYLVNPRIVDKSKNTHVYMEACVSLPKTLTKPVRTVRYEWVKVEADNLPEGHVFEADHPETWNENHENFWKDIGFLECVTVQHLIDILNGVTIKDRVYSTTRVNGKTYGRNDKVMVVDPKTGDSEFIKHKHSNRFLDKGWVIQ